MDILNLSIRDYGVGLTFENGANQIWYTFLRVLVVSISQNQDVRTQL